MINVTHLHNNKCKKKIYIYIYIYILVCCTCMHAVLERKKTQTVIFRDLLVFVHRVDENGATSFISQNALEHTLIEVRNP